MHPLLNATWGKILFNSLLFFHGLLVVAGIIVFLRQNSKNLNISKIPSSFGANGDKEPWYAICALSVVALVLRVWQLNSDLWYDEIVSLVLFVRQPIAETFTSFPSQNQHMFYSLLGHLSIGIFGESAWAVRLPAVLFGLASLIAIYFLARRFLTQTQALSVFALMTVSYHHIWFSQNARGYTALLFFTTLATLFFLSAVKNNQWKDWLLYIVAVVLGMWSHLTMTFVVTAHFLVGLFHFRREKTTGSDLIKPFVAFFLCVSLTLQLYALALPEFFEVALHKGSLKSEWTNPFWMIAETFRGLNIGLIGIPVIFFGAAFLLVGWLGVYHRDSQAAFIMILPGILGGIVMTLLGHNLWPRFFFFSMGFGVIIIMSGIIALPKFFLKKIETKEKAAKVSNNISTAMTALILLASLSMVPRCYTLPKQDFTGARDFIEKNRSSDAHVVAVGLAGFAYKSFYAPQWHFGESKQSVDEALKANEDVWLVYTLPIQLQAYHPDIWRVVERDFEVVRDFPGSLGGGQIVVCRPRKDL